MTAEVKNNEKESRSGFLSLPFLRDLSLVALIVTFAWKLIGADVKFDLASFSFTDFLALVLSLFSVALSVAFYFKANEASNQFYDNTYKFTKDMSEILGRIEAGFGERLRHLDEGYSGVRERLDRMPHYGATPSDVKKEEEEIKRKEAEQRALIEELARKAKLAEHEKQALFTNLAKKNEELEQARGELRQMQRSRHTSISDSRGRGAVVRYVAGRLKRSLSEGDRSIPLSISGIQKIFDEFRTDIADGAIDDMREFDLLDLEGRLTEEGAVYLRRELMRS